MVHSKAVNLLLVMILCWMLISFIGLEVFVLGPCFVVWFLWSFLVYGVQWLSGSVLDLRPRGCGFELHLHHCLVSLSKTL